MAATVVLAASGVIRADPVLLVAGTIPLVYLGVSLAQSTTGPSPSLSATRSIQPTPTVPGRAVSVTLEVQNDGDRPLSDVRIVDGVPESIAVVDGSPREGVALPAGETVTLEYSVISRRGEYPFDDPTIRVRGIAGDVVSSMRVEPVGDGTLICRLDAEAPPMAQTGTYPVGQLDSSTPGHGLVFHSTREHRPDDPADRIDWRHYAKRGTLVSVNYERQVQTTIWLVVDARPVNRVAAGPGRPSAVELAAYACSHAQTDLLRSGHEVGLCVLGQDADGPAGLRFVPARGGRGHSGRIQHALEATVDDQTEGTNVTAQVETVGDTVTPGSQIAYFGPMLDARSIELIRRWRSTGQAVTICSPDVVPANTYSGQFEQVNRRTRLARGQQCGAKTFDWRRGTPLPLVIDRAFSADARVPDATLQQAGPGGGR